MNILFSEWIFNFCLLANCVSLEGTFSKNIRTYYFQIYRQVESVWFNNSKKHFTSFLKELQSLKILTEPLQKYSNNWNIRKILKKNLIFIISFSEKFHVIIIFFHLFEVNSYRTFYFSFINIFLTKNVPEYVKTIIPRKVFKKFRYVNKILPLLFLQT